MAKRALCVGINDYPGSNMDLAGCVNDAMDWQALLEARAPTVLQRLSPAEPDAAFEQGQRDGNGLEFGVRAAEFGIRMLGDVEAT